MNKEDIKTISDYISLNLGDSIIDNLGKIEEVSYIDYEARTVVAIAVARESLIGDLSFRSRATIITFDDIVYHYKKVLIAANGINPHSCDYNQRSNKMKKEDINVTSTHISLLIGDNIIGSTGTQYKVVDIDYSTGMLSISENCNNYNITFDTIAIGDYKKVLEDTDIINTTNGAISIKIGDAIINNGRLLEVTTVAYDSGLVDINEYGDEYTISLADIESVEYIDSVTQIVVTNPRKNRLIIIANGINPRSCDKEDKDNYVSISDNSPKINDFIVDSDGNEYKVDMVDYGNLFIVAISKDGEQRTIHFDKFSSGEYSKVPK